MAVGLLLLAAGNAFAPATGRALGYRLLVMGALVVGAVLLLAIWESWTPDTPRRIALLAGLAIAVWATGIALLPFEVDDLGTRVECRSAIYSAFERESQYHSPSRVPILIPSSCRNPARARLATSGVLFGMAGAGTLGAVRVLKPRGVPTVMGA